MDNDVLRQLGELRTRIDSHDRELSVLVHQQTQLADSIHKRVDTLERSWIDIRKSLNKMELQLDEIAPAMKNLMGLMQVWSRARQNGEP